ncbi:hypothetical protein DPSP01_006972 [Paraphaeosphaeria sporulosa]|uniref:SSCRP protein n=1 Tax=Paraphaeosphaeria sporulosa TaxID=1460663 RepID=A0A177CHE9_9PLEO|nr:uncharacterized protein CC84DRAFT_1204369 [Paraphaeosphaeria sporulosa]OAG06631.1 hypothetical protein CC84DRAFT_1204369 [Paraphaeosphaeria sporulosa]
MRSQLSLLAITAATVSAIPQSQISKRDNINDENGNIKITFSDETVKIGTVKIDEIIAGLSKACSTQGQCDTSTIDFQGQLIAAGRGSSVDDITVHVEPSGAYPTWIHNGLIDGLAAAVKAVAECEDITNTPTCPNPAVYCPAEPITVNECTVPQYWGINYQDKDAANAAPPFIGSDLTIEVDNGGFCGKLLTSMSAVAGAVHGVAGGIFTLLSLACKD